MGDQTRFETAADAAWKPSPYTRAPEEFSSWQELYGLREDCQCLPDKTRDVDGNLLWLTEPWVLKDPHEVVPLTVESSEDRLSAFPLNPEAICVVCPERVQIYQQWGRIWSLAFEFGTTGGFATSAAPNSLRVVKQLAGARQLEAHYSVGIQQSLSSVLARPQDRMAVFADLQTTRTVYPYYDGAAVLKEPIGGCCGFERAGKQYLAVVYGQAFEVFGIREIEPKDEDGSGTKEPRGFDAFEEQKLIDRQNKLEESQKAAPVHVDIEDGYDQIAEQEVEDLFKNDYFCPFEPRYELSSVARVCLGESITPLSLVQGSVPWLLCFDEESGRIVFLSSGAEDIQRTETSLGHLDDWFAVGESLGLSGGGKTEIFGSSNAPAARLWRHGRGQTGAVQVRQDSSCIRVECAACPSKSLCLKELDSFLATGGLFYTVQATLLSVYAADAPWEPLISYQVEPQMALVHANALEVVLASRLHFLETRHVSAVAFRAIEQMARSQALYGENGDALFAEICQILYTSRTPISALYRAVQGLECDGKQAAERVSSLVSKIVMAMPAKLLELEQTTLTILGGRSTQTTSMDTEIPASFKFDPRDAVYFWGLVCGAVLGGDSNLLLSKLTVGNGGEGRDADSLLDEFVLQIQALIDERIEANYRIPQAQAGLFLQAYQLTVQHHCALAFGYLNRFARDEQMVLAHAAVAPLFLDARDVFLRRINLYTSPESVFDALLRKVIFSGRPGIEGALPSLVAWAEFFGIPETVCLEKTSRVQQAARLEEKELLLVELNEGIQTPQCGALFLAGAAREMNYSDAQMVPALEVLERLIRMEAGNAPLKLSVEHLNQSETEWLWKDACLAGCRELWETLLRKNLAERCLLLLARQRNDPLLEFQDASLDALNAFRTVRLGVSVEQVSPRLRAIVNRSAQHSPMDLFVASAPKEAQTLKTALDIFLATATLDTFTKDAALLRGLAAEVLGDGSFQEIKREAQKAEESCVKYVAKKTEAAPDFDQDKDSKLRGMRRAAAEAKKKLDEIADARCWADAQLGWIFAVLD